MLRVWLIVMFAGAGGIFVGSLATSRILGAGTDSPALAASQTSVSPTGAAKLDARQAHAWLQSTVTRGRWMTYADPAFSAEYVSLPGKGYDAMKPGVAMASNRARRPAPEGRAQL